MLLSFGNAFMCGGQSAMMPDHDGSEEYEKNIIREEGA